MPSLLLALLFMIILMALMVNIAAAQPASAGRLSAIDVCSAVDQSGSETTTDPSNERLAATAVMADFLSSVSSPGLVHRMAVVHFGSSAPAAEATELLALPGGMPRIKDALTPRNLGATNFVAAIDLCVAILRSAPAVTADLQRRREVLIYTDGLPEDGTNRSLAAQFADIGQALRRAGDIRVHLIAAVPAAQWAAVESQWRALPLASSERVDQDRSLPHRYLDLLRGELGLARGDERQLSGPGAETQVMVLPYQEGLTVTALSADPQLELQLIGPDGRPADPGVVGNGRAQVLTVRDPQGGSWRVRLKAGQAVTVAVDQVSLQARLIEPSSSAPLGRPLRVVATFLTSDGRALPTVPGEPRFLGATIQTPSGEIVRVELREAAPGRFEAWQTVPTRVPGDYKVSLTLKGGTQTVLEEQVTPVQVAERPYLEVLAPNTTLVPGEPIALSVCLHKAGQLVNPAEALDEDPGGAVIGRLFANGRLVETIGLRLEGERFVGQSATVAEEGVSYVLEAELGARLRDGSRVTDRAQGRTVVAEPTPWQQFLEVLRYVLVGLAVAAAVLVAAYGAWWATRPKMVGRRPVGTKPVTGGGRRMRRLPVPGASRWQAEWVWEDRDGSNRSSRGLVPWPFSARTK